MGFLSAITVIVVVAIVKEFLIAIIRAGVNHSENLVRMRHGYPPAKSRTVFTYGDKYTKYTWNSD